MENNFVVVELVSLNLLSFRFIITYFGTLRMRQIAPFFLSYSFFFFFFFFFHRKVRILRKECTIDEQGGKRQPFPSKIKNN